MALEGERVVGWVAVTPYSDRCCYGGVADLSVYVDPSAQGRGVGLALQRHRDRVEHVDARVGVVAERCIVVSHAAGPEDREYVVGLGRRVRLFH